jgi:hypothetical protein
MKAAYSLLSNSLYVTTLLISSSIVSADPISIRGFASAGFVTGDTQFDFISASDSIGESSTFGADNSIGLQVNAQINDKTEFTSQLLAKGTEDAYNLSAHWGYLAYSASPSVTLRAGRLVLPIAALSEYVDVGYAIPWIRPPAEVYSASMVNNYSGFDLLYTLSFEGMQLTLQPFIGSLPKTSLSGVDASAKQGAGLNTVLHFDQGNLSASRIDVSGLEIAYLGEDLSVDLTFTSLGTRLELGSVLFMAEYAERRSSRGNGSPEIKLKAWYATLGYHIGKFSPHLTYARGKTNSQQTVLPAGTPVATPYGTIPLPETMIIDPAPFSYAQESTTLGVRYDVFNKVAFKLEAQEIKPIGNSWGLFDKDPGDKANLVSFAVDVTF